MHGTMRRALTLGLTALLAVASTAAAQDATRTKGRNGGGPPDNLLLITLDTTRADYLGCYGRKEAVTPTLDALARRGTLFEQAFCQVPITLPSHASILTGKYPRQHGITNNGRERLGENEITLAHLARRHGYRTGAFIAAYVLDKRFGLARGFEEYNDDMGERDRSTEPFHWEQPANVVTDRALAWLERVSSEPFFCWVHYFDPHDPYKPPEAFKEVGANPYDGEIAFVDSQIDRLVKWLAKKQLDDRTLIVVVGDHGESFGEHREVGHSMFLYDTNIHVPLIIARPERVRPGQRVDTVVETVDLFPTIAEWMGWDLSGVEGILGRSLVPALKGEELPPGTAYSESLYGLHTYGWCEQRSLTTARWKYISSVKPELYDRVNDPSEKKNVVEEQPERAQEMEASLRARFEAMPPGEAAAVEYDREARQTLAALGYAGVGGLSSNAFLTKDFPDPKDQFHVVKLVLLGRKELRAENYELASVHFYNAAREAPNSAIAQAGLGLSLLQVYDKQAAQANGVGDFMLLERAQKALEKALELDPVDEQSMVALADVLVRRRHYDEAMVHYRAVLEAAPESYPEVYVKMASALQEQGRFEEARKAYEEALALDPTIAEAHYALGALYLERGQPNEALPHLHDAVRFAPKEKTYRYNLGLALYQLQQYEDAVEQFQVAVELDEDYKDAVINLGIAQYQAGQLGPAQATLVRASQNPVMAPEGFYNLGVIMEKEGRPKMALGFYHKAFELKPDYAAAAGRLATWYLDEGKPQKAVEILRKAIRAQPNNIALLNLFAEVLATSKDDQVRVGSEAVAVAKRALKLVGGAHPDVLRTLAMAYAETGAFDEAVKTADQALQTARAVGRTQLAEKIQAERDGYAAGRPVRSDKY